MRMDQYVGLNKWATDMVGRRIKLHEIGVSILPNGKVRKFDRWVRVPVAKRRVIGTIPGAYKDVAANLHSYTMPDGKVYVEYVQATPWSGGPCYHVALKDSKGRVVKQSLWTDEELANA